MRATHPTTVAPSGLSAELRHVWQMRLSMSYHCVTGGNTAAHLINLPSWVVGQATGTLCNWRRWQHSDRNGNTRDMPARMRIGTAKGKMWALSPAEKKVDKYTLRVPHHSFICNKTEKWWLLSLKYELHVLAHMCQGTRFILDHIILICQVPRKQPYGQSLYCWGRGQHVKECQAALFVFSSLLYFYICLFIICCMSLFDGTGRILSVTCTVFHINSACDRIDRITSHTPLFIYWNIRKCAE